MKTLLYIFGILTIIAGMVLEPATASASFTPKPRATFSSPSFGITTAADYTDITFNLNLGGHPGLVNKTLYVYPAICNYSFWSIYTQCELETSSGVSAYFTDSTASQQYTFPAVAMQYLGSNEVTCFVYDPATQNGDFCGDGTYIDYVWIQYTGAMLPVYRFWSSTKKHHFYTQSSDERDEIIRDYDESVWKYEGIAYYTSRTEACRGTGVYRFWSNTKQGHFYTASEDEKNYILSHYSQNEWKYEGVAFCADTVKQNSSQVPVYRFWSYTQQGHFYTTDEAEKNFLINNDHNWWYEGIAYYANNN